MCLCLVAVVCYSQGRRGQNSSRSVFPEVQSSYPALSSDILSSTSNAASIFEDKLASECLEVKVLRNFSYLSRSDPKLSGAETLPSGTLSKPMSFPVCKFFRSEQGCKFGNKCRYRHSDSFSPPFHHPFYQQNQNEASVNSYGPPATPTIHQGYFSANPSENESSVSYQEAGYSCSSQGSPYLNTPGNSGFPVSSADSPSRFEAQFRNLETSDQNEEAVTASSHSATNPTPRPTRKACHYFARNGNCCFGSRCRFEHVQPHSAAPRFQRQHYAQPTGLEDDGHPSVPQDPKGDKEKRVNIPGRDDGNFRFNPADRPRPLGSAAQDPLKGHAAAGQIADTDQGQEGTEDRSTTENQQVKSDKICQFYLTGRCWKGNRCKFLHPEHPAESLKKKPATVGDRHNDGQRKQKEPSSSGPKPAQKADKISATKQSKEKITPAQQPRAPYVAQGTKKYRRDEVDEVEASRLRRTEIEQLIKRFPKSKVKVNRDCAEYFQCVVSFSPTDPDWVRI